MIPNFTNESPTRMSAQPPFGACCPFSYESLRSPYEDKRKEYLAIGVNDYWVVDPGEQKVIVHWLQGRRYKATDYVGSQPIISVVFPALALTAEQVLKG